MKALFFQRNLLHDEHYAFGIHLSPTLKINDYRREIKSASYFFIFEKELDNEK